MKVNTILTYTSSDLRVKSLLTRVFYTILILIYKSQSFKYPLSTCSKKYYGSFLSVNEFSNVFFSVSNRLDDIPEVDPRRRNPDDHPPEKIPVRMPVVDMGNGKHIDVISHLLKDRILLLGQQVDDEVANVLVAQLLYLANDNPKKDITIYINSPGGSVSAGMAIYDTMQYVPCDVATVCFGMAASMGAFLLGAGAPGKRRALPNARIMIHQPLGGAQGQASDIEIQAKEILFTREVLNTYIAEYTDQPKKKIEEDCDRDFFMTSEEAMDYGIIDEVVKTKTSHIMKPPMPSLL